MGDETMRTSQLLHTHTALAAGLRELFRQLEEPVVTAQSHQRLFGGWDGSTSLNGDSCHD